MPVGRPSSLTPEVQRKVCEAIAAGNYYQAAAAYAGITYSCLAKWLKKGKRAKRGRFFQFFHAVREADAAAEITIVAQWRQQIPENWQAARDFLARRHPERWGPKDRHDVDVTTKGRPLVLQIIEQEVSKESNDVPASRNGAATHGTETLPT